MDGARIASSRGTASSTAGLPPTTLRRPETCCFANGLRYLLLVPTKARRQSLLRRRRDGPTASAQCEKRAWTRLLATAAEVIEQGVMCLDDTAVGAGATANLCAPRWTPLRPRTLRSDAFFIFGNRVWPR